MGNKMRVWIYTIVILSYFVFTSGTVYEAMGSNVTDTFIVPFSYALSGERTGLAGVHTQDDINCVLWIKEHKAYPILADYNGRNLLVSIVKKSNTYGNIMLPYMTESFYYLMRSWNTQNKKMIGGQQISGVRTMVDLPDMSDWEEVYRSGDSVVYRIER